MAGLNPTATDVTTDLPESDAPAAGGCLAPRARAAIGGTLVAFSLPPWGFWPLAFVGVAIFEAAKASTHPSPGRRARVRVRAAVDGDRHVLDLVPHRARLHRRVVAFAGLHAAAAAVAPTGPWRTVGGPAAHTLVETIRLGFPFGGVPLATLGIAQAGGPLLGVARIGGVILLTWIVFQVGCALAGPAPAVPRTMPRRVVGRGAPAAPAPRRRSRTARWRCWRSCS